MKKTIMTLLIATPLICGNQYLCPFYCTRTWVCDYVPCKDQTKAAKLCEVKKCTALSPSECRW